MSLPLAEDACEAREPLPAWPGGKAFQTVGHPAQRSSAHAKVTGSATYACDVVLPGMVHAVILRSTIPCGRVVHFDASLASALSGVLLVAGPDDLAWPPYPPRLRPSVSAEVRFVGEEIGAVVAETESAAREAARLVEVRYDAEPAVVTLDQALAPGAPRLPAGASSASSAATMEVLAHGDLAAAMATAEVRIAATYTTSAQHHNPLEPHGCVASWDGDSLTLWDGNQGGHLIREWLARALGLPNERIRVISRFVGGAFGSKVHLQPYHLIAVALARRLGRPVRLFMARREEFIASHQRAATRRSIELGARRDGTLAFIHERVHGQAGPCGFLSRVAVGAANGLRLHSAQAVRAELHRVLTNTQAPTPFRGPAAAEDLFCLEQAMDELASALALDPLELRLRNLAEADLLAGLPYAGKHLQACYRTGAAAFGWRHRPPLGDARGDIAHGIGLGAVAYDATLYEPSVVEVALRDDGDADLRLGITEIGCGADTVFAQIAAETLGWALHRIHMQFGDTAATPRSIDATNHSRTTAVVGPAVRAAAQQLKDALAAGARTPLLCRAERERSPSGVFAAMFGAHFVEVAVDRRSGRVSVVRAMCAHDAGRVINPRLAAGQVHGGFLQGMGMALHEERVLDPRSGVMLNAAMWAYRTPGITEAPAGIDFIDAGQPDGGNSLGVKGIGEPPLIASGAAIANAIHNAIGVRMRDYPITPARVLAALHGGGA